MQSSITRGLLVGLAVLLVGCQQQEDCLHLQKLSDEQKLKLADLVPIGATYSELKACGVVKASQTSEGRTHEVVPLQLYGRRWDIDFDFEENRVSHCNVWLRRIDPSMADSLYATIQTFYSGLYGAPKEYKAKDDNRTRGSRWCLPTCQIHLKYLYYPDEAWIAWGYAQPCPPGTE